MELKPLKNFVLIAEVKMETKSEAGIILEKAASAANSNAGKVLAVGPDVKEVAVGDTVYLEWAKGAPVKVDGAQRVMIKEEFIAAVLEREGD